MAGEQARLETVRAMTERLAHRGPDGEGFWADAEQGVALGHRRLAIQDLSPSGDQPMLHGAHVLTYNGELYNHEALRAALPGPWRSTGDTEVVLHLLARDGSDGLQQLVGMFALALWDGAARRLLLVRDRLGIKPLYYRLSSGGIAFASELKALLVLGTPPIDRSAVRDYLFHGYVPSPKSIYEGIAKLPAGHWLEWSEGRVRIERYWNPSTAVTVREAPAALERLDARLREVVPAHTVADVPVGVFLSGGLDSALTTYYLDHPHTFSLGFEERDRSELAAARMTAEHLHTQHAEITAPARDFVVALECLPQVFDEPFGDSAAWSNYLIAECARREVTVALSGEGGDEIFCGYPRYWSRIGARSTVLNRSLAPLVPALSRMGASLRNRSYQGLAAFAAALGGLNAEQIGTLLAPAWLERDYDYWWFYRKFWREELAPLEQLRWLDLNTDLAEGLLTKVDRSSMAHSLEVRPPLLDHRLVELMLSIDPHLLVDEAHERGKVLVRTLMAPRLPPAIIERPKSGFGLPVRRWLARHPELLAGAVRRLIERGVLARPVGTDFRRAWALLMLDRWFTTFG